MATLDQLGNVLPDTVENGRLDDVVVTAQRPRFDWNSLLLALAGAVLVTMLEDATRTRRRR